MGTPTVNVVAEVAHLLDVPVTILERIYDLGMVRLPRAGDELRTSRLATVAAVNAYESAYRKAQLDILQQADKDGVKMTEGKRELAAKDKVADESMQAMIAKAQESACQDLVFELKDQLAAMNSILGWKQSELKATTNATNARQQDPPLSDQDYEERAATNAQDSPAQDPPAAEPVQADDLLDLADLAPAGIPATDPTPASAPKLEFS